MAKMTETGRAVLTYLQSNVGKTFTAKEIAEAVGIRVQSVNGSIIGLAKKGFVERKASIQTYSDGSTKEIKSILVKDSILGYDPDAVPTLVSEQEVK